MLANVNTLHRAQKGWELGSASGRFSMSNAIILLSTNGHRRQVTWKAALEYNAATVSRSSHIG